MTDLKVETGKFTTALKADEVKASNWITRHPGWALAIGFILLAGDVYFALKSL
jgi:hypothetical protein